MKHNVMSTGIIGVNIRPLQYDSLFPISSGSLRHAGGRFIIHYSLSLYVQEHE